MVLFLLMPKFWSPCSTTRFRNHGAKYRIENQKYLDRMACKDLSTGYNTSRIWNHKISHGLLNNKIHLV